MTPTAQTLHNSARAMTSNKVVKCYLVFSSTLQQGGYSPNGAFSEMYGSIGGHYSSHYGNLNYSSAVPFHPPPSTAAPWRGSQNFIH